VILPGKRISQELELIREERVTDQKIQSWSGVKVIIGIQNCKVFGLNSAKLPPDHRIPPPEIALVLFMY